MAQILLGGPDPNLPPDVRTELEGAYAAIQVAFQSVQPPQAQTGNPTAFTALFGDLAWKEFQIGMGGMWFTTVQPDWGLFLNGQSVLRGDYPTLFGLWGTTFGSVDALHFTVPDLRAYFPFGVAISGTGSTIGNTFGSLDHTHSAGSHSHTVDAHTHTVGDHVHGGTGHTHTFTTGQGNDSTWPVDTGAVVNVSQEVHTHTGTTNSGGAVNSQGVVGGAFASGSASPGTSSASGTTGTANPPGFAVNFIVKAR